MHHHPISAVLANLALAENIVQDDLNFVRYCTTRAWQVGIGSLTFAEIRRIEQIAESLFGYPSESRLTREDAEALAGTVKQSNELAKSASRSFLPKELPCP